MSKIRTIGLVSVLAVGVIVILLASIFHGDAPISKIIISSKPIFESEKMEDIEDIIMDHKQQDLDEDVYIIDALNIGRIKEMYRTSIPEGTEIYINVYFTEWTKGSTFEMKWIRNDVIVKEENKTMTKDKRQIITYLIEKHNVKEGIYNFEIYHNGKKLYQKQINISKWSNFNELRYII